VDPIITISSFFRCIALPCCMSHPDSWKFCYHPGALASPCNLDILLRSKVILGLYIMFHMCNMDILLFILLHLMTWCQWFFEGRTKQLGPVLKLVTCIAISVILILWPLIGILGSITGGAGYGFFEPVLATFNAVGEGKTDEFIHCFVVFLMINLLS